MALVTFTLTGGEDLLTVDADFVPRPGERVELQSRDEPWPSVPYEVVRVSYRAAYKSLGAFVYLRRVEGQT